MSTETPVPRADATPDRHNSPERHVSRETLEWVVAPAEKPADFDLRVPIAWHLQLIMVIAWSALCLRVAVWFDSYWGCNLMITLWVMLPMELYRRGREHDRRTRIKPSPFYFWF